MGIGAAKSGTSTLAWHLKQHPQIGFPKSGRKELHFFDECEQSPQNVQEYIEEFQANQPAQIAKGEFTPAYIFDPACPGRIKDALGTNMQFVAILRDPIKRAWSHYCHAVRHWSHPSYREKGYPIEELSFEEAIEAEPERMASGRFHIRHQSYFSKGLYAQQLERYFRLFDRELMYVVLYDDFIRDVAGIVSSIYTFLGVSCTFPINCEIRLNAQSEGEVPVATRRWLLGRYKESIEQLENLLNRKLPSWKSLSG